MDCVNRKLVTNILMTQLFFFKILFIYLRETETEIANREHKWGGEGEAGSPLSRECYTGLDPRPLASWAS